jgi:ribosome recycling factor
MHPHLEQAKQKFAKALEHLHSEFSSIRSGRATPALIEQVKVEAYGAFTPLIELASITAPETRLLVVQPWDKSILKNVEKSLQQANLGASPVIDGQLIRINLPSLSEERRREFVKLVNNKIEETRGVFRHIREEVLKLGKDEKTAGKLPEDEFFGIQKDLQKLVDDNNEKVKKMGEDKEKEIMTI